MSLKLGQTGEAVITHAYDDCLNTAMLMRGHTQAQINSTRMEVQVKVKNPGNGPQIKYERHSAGGDSTSNRSSATASAEGNSAEAKTSIAKTSIAPPTPHASDVESIAESQLSDRSISILRQVVDWLHEDRLSPAEVRAKLKVMKS